MSSSIKAAVFAFVCLLLCTECKVSGNDQEGKLVFASVIFRHGDRTPYQPYPLDPWRDQKWWPEPFEALTNVGKQQHYRLGGWLRTRYNSLVSKRYNHSEMYVLSTDVDRTLMSAQSNLAGFYVPEGEDVWMETLPWQPIPVHTVPASQDYLLGATKPCSAYDEMFKELLETDDFKNLLAENKEFFQFLSDNTGLKIQTIQDVEYLYSTLEIEDLHGFLLPEWTRDVFPEKLLRFAKLSFASRAFTPNLARLKSGALLKEILDHGKRKSMRNLTENYWVYSGHDTTLANMLSTLGIYKDVSFNPPPFAAAILFEFYEFSAGDFRVQIYYKNSSDVHPMGLEPMNIPGCGTSCPLDKMFEIYDSVMPQNLEEECKTRGILNNSREFLITLASILAMLTAVITINLLFVLRKKVKKDAQRLPFNLIPSRMSKLSNYDSRNLSFIALPEDVEQPRSGFGPMKY